MKGNNKVDAYKTNVQNCNKHKKLVFERFSNCLGEENTLLLMETYVNDSRLYNNFNERVVLVKNNNPPFMRWITLEHD